MKQIIVALLCLVVVGVLGACNKDNGPKLVFKTGNNYIYEDNVLARADSNYRIGITATPSGGDSKLGSYKIVRQYDNDSPETIRYITLIGDNQSAYNMDYEFKTRKQFGKERYTFTITDKDGKSTTISLMLTTH
jgi:hypothetical protein